MKNKMFDKPTPLPRENPLSQNLIVSKLAGFLAERELSRLSQTCKSLYNKIHYPLKKANYSIFQQQNYFLPYQPVFPKEHKKISNNLLINTLMPNTLLNCILIVDECIISAGTNIIKILNTETQQITTLHSEKNYVLVASSKGKLLCSNTKHIQCWDLQEKTSLNYDIPEKNVCSTGLLPLENDYVKTRWDQRG